MATHKALVAHEYGKTPVYEDTPKPQAQPGQLLIKVEGSTVNPSDRLRCAGVYFPVPLPATMGLEGTGTVVEANGENVQEWVGKRVCFTQAGSGSWGEFAVSSPDTSFAIDKDVTLTSAASGIVNPLTVVGMIDIYQKTAGKKGIISSAAASSLGRMLNKRCQTLGIPLLNIVRRQEHFDILKAEGAKHIIITKGDWNEEYKAAIKEHGFNVFFDALGGGETLETLVDGLGPNSFVHIYGMLEGKPFSLKSGISLCRGVHVTGYLLFSWYGKLTVEEKEAIKKEYSSLLKGDLATTCYKTLKYDQLAEAMELSVSKTIEGKITLIPN